MRQNTWSSERRRRTYDFFLAFQKNFTTIEMTHGIITKKINPYSCVYKRCAILRHNKSHILPSRTIHQTTQAMTTTRYSTIAIPLMTEQTHTTIIDHRIPISPRHDSHWSIVWWNRWPHSLYDSKVFVYLQHSIIMEKISVVIPTARSHEEWQPLLDDLAQCSIDEIIIVYDALSSNEQRETLSTTWEKTSTIPLIIEHPWTNNRIPCANASIVRNIWLTRARYRCVVCMDDDNRVSPDFFSSIRMYRKPGIALIPYEYTPHGTLRSHGYQWLSPWTTRPIPACTSTIMTPLAFASSNCFVIDNALHHRFDEAIPFVYEDFLFFVQWTQKNHQLFSCSSLAITHHMKAKTKDQDLYVHTTTRAYQKGKHRILLAYRIFSWWQYIIRLLVWLPIHSLYCITIILMSSTDHKRERVISFLRGSYQWRKHLAQQKR